MDIAYALKQLDHEILAHKIRLHEKQAARDKLYLALSPQEQPFFDPPDSLRNGAPDKPAPTKKSTP
jgi:hypothetical protein